MTRNLKVAAVDVALVQSDATVDCHLLIRAATHGIVAALNDCSGVGIRKSDGAILCVVLSAPDTGFGLNERLVAIGVKLRYECNSAA